MLRNETKLWFREASIVTVSNLIENRRRDLSYAGNIEVVAHACHDALLQAIHTHCDTLNRGLGGKRRH